MLPELANALHLSPATFYSICFLALLLVAVVIGFILNRIFRSWAKKVRNHLGEILLTMGESLAIPMSILTAIYVALEFLTLPRKFEQIGSKIIFALVIIIIFYFLAKVVILFFTRWGQQDPALIRVTQPASFMVRVIFAMLAIIIIFQNFGINLTAIWTTLGVGSVAVALALQETLSNFFAGLYLLADRPINPGDYVKLDAGQEGFVERIGWRSTSLRMLANNLVVIPNSTLAKAVITNYSLPSERMAFSLRVGVSYGSDPRHVEKVLLEVAQQAVSDGMDGLLAEPKPAVSFIPGFGDSSLDFSLAVHIHHFKDQFPVQSELRKRIVERFTSEGIEFPFPTRTLVLDKSVYTSLAGQRWPFGAQPSVPATRDDKAPPDK